MLSSEVEDLNKRNSPPSDAGLAKTYEHPLELEANVEKIGTADADGNEDVVEGRYEGAYEDEDEEEDVDFNPLLKETPSREASSSLSSENEGFDVDSGGNVTSALATDSKAKPCNPVHEHPAGDTDQGEEVVTQTLPSSIGPCQKGLNSGSLLHEKSDELGYNLGSDNDLVVEELNNVESSKNPAMNLDDNTAICMRTRARYSLASFTLDELETFLQETDDDDDLRNVDDEEEYRKFLAAVLQGGDADTENVHGDGNIDDEDNDADFELELEEALESDVEEDARDGIPERVYGAVGRRPRTRQNRQQKASAERNKKLLGQLKRPLRPLLPNALITRVPFSAGNRNTSMISHAPSYLPPVNDGSINGFTLHQIGQLHCLIHEHVQLLIQVFSICILEPSRRHIAPKFQEMISEMLRVRDHVLAWRRLPYPSFCFFPPHVHPSVPTDFSRSLVAPCINETCSVVDVWRSCSPGNSIATPDIISSSNGTRECPRIGNNPDSSAWVPYINGPVVTVLDVAPLRLVGSYIEDVYAVVQDYHRRPVGASCDTHFDKEPLFPLYNSQASAEPSNQVPRTAYSTSNMVLPSSTSDQAPKRTMASALVERAKKQSVAPVPKEIAKLAQRFYPLFNPALYPHKSPPAPVANRVLFTDAEDELLALGLMEYNTDWKAIQQRFLPCKSKHQIFVRQKNRSSSKAPENPIKAVRRMKNSPLTAEEILRIQEGLKTCKLDWMSIWKFIVPYRDPSLLPRQWRIAHGTQKSYKLDANKKAKRRLYELRRRNCKPAASPNWHTSSEKEDNNTDKAGEENKNGDNQADKEDEAYVHEAFLADWRPGTSNFLSKSPDLRPREKSPPIQPLVPESSSRELLNNIQTRDFQPPISNEFQTAARSSSISQPCSRAYRARRNNHSRLVKLAPDLPPVNLPPSVRVISQSAFKSYQSGTSSKTPIFCPGAVSGVTKEVKCTPNLVPINPVKAGQVRTTPVNNGYSNPQQRNSVIRNNQVAEQNDESDLQMHPLLFQAPEDGHFQYYPLNSSSNTSTFNFLSGSPPQLNLTLFHNQRPASHAVNFLEKSLNLRKSTSSVGIDFHPLLQKSNDINCSMVGARSAALLSANQDSSEDHCSKLGTAPRISDVNSSSSAASVRLISPNEKINELDLDIHLSSTSRRQKTQGIRDVNERDMAGPAGSALDSRRLGSQKTKDSFKDSSQYTPAACAPDRTISKLNSSVRALDVSGGGKSRSNVDNIEDQSLPEIVMEQEELSDSEDEIGENVEFECEEMADSEAEEGYDSEPITDIQNEEMETAATSANLVDEQCEPNAGGNPDDRVTGTSEDHKRDRKLGNSSRSSCLNLNSHPPVSPTEKNIEVSKQIRSSGSRNQATLPPEQVQNLNSGITPSEKPRKRARNKDSSIDRSRSKRRKSGLNEDMNSSSSKHVSEDGPGKF